MVLGGLFAVAVAAAVVQTGGGKDESTAIPPGQQAIVDKAKKERTAKIQIAAAGAVDLKRAMKDPAAFELTSLLLMPSGAACYEYRAKNSFGAVMPGRAVMTTKGKIYTDETSRAAFVKNWNTECTKPGGEELKYLMQRLGVFLG